MNSKDYSHLTSSDNAYINDLYEQYKSNPEDLDPSWVFFFKGFDYRQSDSGEGNEVAIHTSLEKEFKVYHLINSYRSRGHLLSDTNPIRPRKDRQAKLELEYFGLTEGDLGEVFQAATFLGLPASKLSDIIDHLKRVYCYKIGIEYMHSDNSEIRQWIQEKFEKEYHTIDLPLEKKKQILHKLNQAQVFENFLQTKYIGQKRFSLEGGETTIPALDAMIEKGSELGVKQFVFGMAHRGRLNVLANIMGKSYEFIFNEFQGGALDQQHTGGGDVKYHQGFASVEKRPNGKEVYLKIMHNPSHLEAVAPVALGYARAQADIRFKGDQDQVLPIMIHGDAAVAGQGVVYETLQMAQLEAYQCHGAIHFVINNQIGFTTDWSDGRSSHYSTSIARTLDAPVLHVNGDDPESVVYAMELACEFRQKFKTDIFIDMVCYRKHGHNEGDEPKFTQPQLYGMIAKTKNPRELYIQSLIDRGSINKELADSMQKEFNQMLSDRFNNVQDKNLPPRVKGPHTEWLDFRWSKPEDFEQSPKTAIDQSVLDQVIETLTTPPSNVNMLKKAVKIINDRKKLYDNNTLDWALCELSAYGSLLLEGANVRMSGQDVIRGTFSHRHAKVFDEQTNESFCLLNHMTDKQGKFHIYNSHLSEYAVLGFEFGYSLASPNSLNIWEAQFGDFANTAQVIIDQFICSAEVKWDRMSDLILLLPHGYEGQGPEHSNARPERFLQLAAQYNMAVLSCSTPANFFHALRRQMAWPFRKPAVVFTPKSLLRSPQCVSRKEDLTSGTFEEILFEQNSPELTEKFEWNKYKKVLFCTGKVFYDLLSEKQKQGREDVLIVRIEQLYPFPSKKFEKILERTSGAKWMWVQEEPENMGYWGYLVSRMPKIFVNFELASRPLSATPATGFPSVHKEELENILKKSFE